MVTNNSRTFPALSGTPEAFYQDPVVSLRCLNIETNSCGLGRRVPGRALATSDFFVYTVKILANFCRFWHLHLHHCVHRSINHRLLTVWQIYRAGLILGHAEDVVDVVYGRVVAEQGTSFVYFRSNVADFRCKSRGTRL